MWSCRDTYRHSPHYGLLRLIHPGDEGRTYIVIDPFDGSLFPPCFTDDLKVMSLVPSQNRYTSFPFFTKTQQHKTPQHNTTPPYLILDSEKAVCCMEGAEIHHDW